MAKCCMYLIYSDEEVKLSMMHFALKGAGELSSTGCGNGTVVVVLPSREIDL